MREQLRASGRPGSRPWEAGELAALGERAGIESVPEPDPGAALDAARSEAIRRRGVLIVAGSHYLLATARARLERRADQARRKGG